MSFFRITSYEFVKGIIKGRDFQRKIGISTLIIIYCLKVATIFVLKRVTKWRV